MDEVNADDLNELESRLYAQIHHEEAQETTANTNAAKGGEVDGQQQQPESATNKVPATRYWARGNTTQNYTNKSRNLTKVNTPAPKEGDTSSGGQNVTEKNQKKDAALDNVTTVKPQPSFQVPKPKKGKFNTNNPNTQKTPPLNTNLRLNPAVTARQNRKQRQERQQHKGLPPTPPNVLRDGPFAQKAQKLKKALRIDNKRAKTKQVQAKKKLVPIETICLHSDESDTDEVVVVPTPPPITISVDDSDEENDVEDTLIKPEIGLQEVLKFDENAVDAADVEMEKASFMKPHSATVNGNEKRIENSSRCTSPCSVLSSDDFIGQNDRTRLLEGSGPADDEDLIVLMANVDNSQTEPPNSETPIAAADNTNMLPLQEESSTEVECLDFVPPTPTAASAMKPNYRVEQPQFRALDVYESESDITDSVYSKGVPKPTIIRSIGSSSDEEEPVVTSQKMKRLRKRRASGSQRESETNNEDDSTNSEYEEEQGIGATGVPFICRGVAVENCKTRKRKHSQSVNARRGSTGGCASGQMCDSEFIATLNNLAQGGATNVQGTDVDGEDETDIDMEKVPTAREIVEQVLEQRRQKRAAKRNVTAVVEVDTAEKPTTAISTNAAVGAAGALPDDAMAELDNVFATIDQLDQCVPQSSDDDAIDITSDSSDVAEFVSHNAAEKQVVVTDPPAAVAGAIAKTNRRDTSNRVYNVIFSRGTTLYGGLGWNDEMRKFYNNSWRGEHFNLKDVWQKLNPNKKLWKIYTEDRFPKDRRYSNLKCNNCCEFGHIRSKCKRPKKPPICYMCGERGHFEPRCPNTICLRCGNKTHIFTKSCNACTFQNRLICPLCKVRGHTLNFCPDKWRRYHSTTEPNAYPNSHIEYKTKKYCCICGKRGHHSDTCKSVVRFMEYPVIVSNVRSHQKSYGDQSMRTLNTAIAFNLLYKPSEDYSFELAENTTGENYYGRFLRSVGMGYMLKRKRTLSATATAASATAVASTHAKQTKRVAQQYTPNPYLKTAAAEAAAVENIVQDDAPDQVQEISESGNQEVDNAEVDAFEVVSIDSSDVQVITAAVEPDEPSTQSNVAANAATEENSPENEAAAVEVQTDVVEEIAEQTPESSVSRFKAPIEVSPIQVHVQPQPQAQATKESEPLHMDSDSNYSFSEHFDLPTTSAAAAAMAATQHPPKQQPKPREMEALPDFIPLNANEEDDDVDMVALQAGISRRYVTAADTDDDDESRALSPLPDLPCEAKIYLTHFNSKYLLSPEGHKFLEEKSKACDINARLDFTSVGHVLVIFGLPSNQNNFHRELLLKYRQLTDQLQQRRLENTQKVPKRTDVLIRFLRENLNQLFTNLGNVNDLLRRLKYSQNQQSKNGFKLAEKARRSLNMILLGQAGLLDGNMHMEKLLTSLRTLINDNKAEETASNELRDEIDAHWKVIFTSYRHDNYPELVQSYNKLLSKNRMPKLNIDPLLLGNKMLDTSLTNEQKERMQQQPKARAEASIRNVGDKRAGIVPNPLNPNNSKLLNKKQAATQQQHSSIRNNSPPPPAPSMKIKAVAASPLKGIQANKKNTTPNAKTKANVVAASTRKAAQPPCVNPEQRSTVATKVKDVTATWQSACDNLLTEIEAPAGELRKGLVRVSKGPSIFWSRESIKYLDECIKLAESNNALLEKLQRVQKKSRSGSLSYNDYRAVIKLHSAMMGK